MTLSEFIDKYTGKFLDYDLKYGNQCSDLMRFYLVEVLELPDSYLRAIYARYVFEKFDQMYGRSKFVKISNTPEGIPSKGDIVFWGTSLGTAGHVAIFIDGDANSFNSFDQNYPLEKPCHVQNHSYKGVLGWLRYKYIPVEEPTQDDELQRIIRFLEEKGCLDEGKVREMFGALQDKANLEKKVEDLQDSLNTKGNTIAKKDQVISDNDNTIQALTSQVKVYKDQTQDLAELLDCTRDFAEIVKNVKEAIGNEDKLTGCLSSLDEERLSRTKEIETSVREGLEEAKGDVDKLNERIIELETLIEKEHDLVIRWKKIAQEKHISLLERIITWLKKPIRFGK